jgi:hypothetical protein
MVKSDIKNCSALSLLQRFHAKKIPSDLLNVSQLFILNICCIQWIYNNIEVFN